METKNILLVEDDKFFREMLAGKLVAGGLKVEVAEDGNKAIEKLKTYEPKLIILDLLLPDMDGFGVLGAVRKSGNKVPVIVLSNLDSADDMQKIKDLGGNDFLVKSNFTLNEIVNKAKEIVG